MGVDSEDLRTTSHGARYDAECSPRRRSSQSGRMRSGDRRGELQLQLQHGAMLLGRQRESKRCAKKEPRGRVDANRIFAGDVERRQLGESFLEAQGRGRRHTGRRDDRCAASGLGGMRSLPRSAASAARNNARGVARRQDACGSRVTVLRLLPPRLSRLWLGASLQRRSGLPGRARDGPHRGGPLGRIRACPHVG